MGEAAEEVILADEPIASLEPESSHRVLAALSPCQMFAP